MVLQEDLAFPRAYKTGEQDFYGRLFSVSQDVLIPRPETEQIVDLVLKIFGKTKLPGVKPPKAKILEKGARILDVGTGSGCIAETIKLELPETVVLGADISWKALEIAKKNAKKLGADVKFLESDLMKSVPGEFEVVVANLPYVDKNWEWLKKPESAGLKFEPEIALYAKDGGLELIFRLILEVKDRTRFLVFEADPCQHERIVSLANQHGFTEVERAGFGILLDKKA